MTLGCAPLEGTVISGTNNFFYIEDESGALFRCAIKGKVLKSEERLYNPLAPGDLVRFKPSPHSASEGEILGLIPRRNKFSRWNEKRGAVQLLAANIDLVAIVTSVDEPPFRPRFVDRALVQADVEGVEPLIIVNKSDLEAAPNVHERVSDWMRIGYSALYVSAVAGEGIDELRQRLLGKTAVLAGQSGAGKSSILNALLGKEEQRTAAISAKYRRGVHTTTCGALFACGEAGCAFRVIDTPGIRRFAVHGISPSEAILCFPEMEALAGKCLYGASCSHLEEDGCKIQEAICAGAILPDRFESYIRIREELDSAISY